MKSIKNKIIGVVSSMLAMVAITTALGTNAMAAVHNIDIMASDYGYGEYIVTARGTGYDGVYDEDLIRFYYYPVNGELTENKDTGDYTVHLEYDADDGTDASEGAVASVIVNILDANGNPVGPSPITVPAPNKSVSFNLDEYGLASGTYTVEITAYDRNGTKLYKAIKIGEIDYNAIPVPDTGSFFQSLNISRIDYLVTGLIIFALVGISGAVFIAKRNKASRSIGRRKH